jgi:hypothetical protein
MIVEKLAPQILWLNLSGCEMPESAWQRVGKLEELRVLNLAKSSVSDESLGRLGQLPELRKLNLAQTNVTEKGLTPLSRFPRLHFLFLYRTPLAGTDFDNLRKSLPNVKIDTGGYSLPFLQTDTLRLK